MKVTRVCVCQLLLIGWVPPNILINSEINLRSLLVIANIINARLTNQNWILFSCILCLVDNVGK